MKNELHPSHVLVVPVDTRAYARCKHCDVTTYSKDDWGALKYPCSAFCPKCNTKCDRDSVDVGVGIIHGPFGCPNCGWSEYEEYDLSEGQDPFNEKGGMKDQYGGYYPPGNTAAIIGRAAKKCLEKSTENGE